MGANSSSMSDLHSNEYLNQFVGKVAISPNDPFWNQLLSFTFTPPRTCADCRLLEESVQSLLQTFLTNNLYTGNYRSLVHVFVTRATELKASAQCENNIFTWQTFNAMFILRCVTKYFIQTVTEDNFVKQFQSNPQDGSGEKQQEDNASHALEKLLNVLVEIIVDVPILDFTYAIHVEAVNTLLVILSAQMFSARPASKSLIYRLIMQGKCSIHAFLFVKVLLQNFVKQEVPPYRIHGDSHGSIIIGLASGLWNVLTLGYGRSGSQKDQSSENRAVLASQSLLLLLVLVNHCTSEKDLPNPYRQALFSFSNSQETTTSSSTDEAPAFKVDCSKLFSTLCSTLQDDNTTLLLYLLLHRNPNFRTYVLSRTDVDTLVMPILKILYQAPERSSHHIYMALIILLILSEDDLFNEAVHDIVIKNISWYTERSISEISLGGLLVLVVIRTIQFNITRMRDKYLHTNCLAALANMSSHFKALHPYVSQRFVSLFEHLAKRLTRVVDQLKNRRTCGGTDSEDDFSTDLMLDLSVLEEVLRMVLEILNSCLTHQLVHNPNLVYTLLYKRHVFEAFRTHPTFQDIIQNLETVLTYFSARLDATDAHLTVSEVYELIREASLQWPRDKLKKFPELKFKYVEEEQPEEFFIPYVWSLVYHYSDLYWNTHNIILFNPHKGT